MAKKRRKKGKKRGRRTPGPGGSKKARKQRLGVWSLGCFVLLLVFAGWLILPRVLSGGG